MSIVIIIFSFVICFIGALAILDSIYYKNYPIVDQYWIAAVTLIAFLIALIGMMIAGT